MSELKSMNSTAFYPLGVHLNNGVLHVCIKSEKESFGIILYNDKREEITIIDMTKANRIGLLSYGDFFVGKYKKLLYRIYVGNSYILDDYMREYVGENCFGLPLFEDKTFGVLKESAFDWKDEKCPKTPFCESIYYLINVRGFTKHSSSKVKGKGCFAGLSEKIEYLRELGVTSLELMPVYPLKKVKDNRPDFMKPVDEVKRPNYWGFQEGFYYCLNKELAYGKYGETEFKELVRELHDNNIEVILQFYFPITVKRGQIIDILTFWKMNYHVDGFHLKGDDLPKKMINEALTLKDCKILYDYVDDYEIEEGDEGRVAVYSDEYMYDMRRFLKGDEGVTDIALRRMREVPKGKGILRFFTNYYGFTMSDLVSYDRKHNENNNENNLDGQDFNLSWNCGIEGPSRKKAIVSLREQQIRNILCLLFFTQGTPLIYMGDEFGNSQKGNNNPYCQDNDVTWLNWNDLNKNKDLFGFIKSLIGYRNSNQFLHPQKELRLMDYLSCGFPDLSYHGADAWRPELYNYNRHVGLLFAGQYGGIDNKYIYLAINMHWEKHDLAMPNLPEGLSWKCVFDTTKWNADGTEESFTEGKVCLMPRSIKILESEGVITSPKKKRKKSL